MLSKQAELILPGENRQIIGTSINTWKSVKEIVPMKPAVPLLSLVIFLGTKRHFKCILVVGNECLNVPVSFSTIVRSKMTLSQKADSPLNEKHSQKHSNTCYGNAKTDSLTSLNARPSAFGRLRQPSACGRANGFVAFLYRLITVQLPHGKTSGFHRKFLFLLVFPKITLLADFNLLESTPF